MIKEAGIFQTTYRLKVKVKVKSLSRVRPFATPWTVAHQAPLFMEFSRQEHWSGLYSFLQGSSWPRDWTRISRIGGRCFNLLAAREALVVTCNLQVTDKKIHIFLHKWCLGITPLTFHFEPFFSLRWLGKQDSSIHGHLSAKGDSSWKGREASRKKECGREMRRKLLSMCG